MKIKFNKNEKGATVVTVNGEVFASQSYIEMIKQLHAGTKVEVEFGENITKEEQSSINEMVKKINAVDTKINETNKATEAESDTAPDYPADDINPEVIPF